MPLPNIIGQALSLPPHVVVQRGLQRLRRSLVQFLRERTALSKGTYTPSVLCKLELPGFDLPEIAEEVSTHIAELVPLVLAHKAALLGSAEVSVNLGVQAPGFESVLYPGRVAGGRFLPVNPSNRRVSDRLRSLISPTYEPIDWNRDFRSGYCWSPELWWTRQPYGHQPAVDIKVPWDFSRMQHLPVLALAWRLNLGEQYRTEFFDQLYDFAAACPPGFGVNWITAMDVGIRLANIALGLTLLSAKGMVSDTPEVLATIVADHGSYIWTNLEWSADLRGNHYLANLLGLCAAAALIPSHEAAPYWLAFALQELGRESELQWNSDGSNFEASLPYHGLSTEILAATLLWQVLAPEDVRKRAARLLSEGSFMVDAAQRTPVYEKRPSLHLEGYVSKAWHTLERSLGFAQSVAYPTMKVPQIGDNDSGHVFDIFLHELNASRAGHASDGPDFSKLLALRAVLHGNQWSHGSVGNTSAHTWVLAQAEATLVMDSSIGQFNAYTRAKSPPATKEQTTKEQATKEQTTEKQATSKVTEPTAPEQAHRGEEHILGEDILGEHILGEHLPEERAHAHNHWVVHAGFGLGMIRRSGYVLSLRAGSIGQHGKGGHAHNDHCSFTLYWGELEWIVDAGTFVYTPFPSERNLFRSTMFHNTLVFAGLEQNDFVAGGGGSLFWLKSNRAQGKVEGVAPSTLRACHEGYGVIHERLVEGRSHSLHFQDTCAREGKREIGCTLHPRVQILHVTPHEIQVGYEDQLMRFETAVGNFQVRPTWYSPEYGRRIETSRIVLVTSEVSAQWTIDLSMSQGQETFA